MESWPSGLRRRFAKPLGTSKAPQRFESSTLRQIILVRRVIRPGARTHGRANPLLSAMTRHRRSFKN